MRRLVAIIAALFLCTAPVDADVSVGNGSIGVPLTATQGGTGQTSFTTNCVVAASSSTALTCTLTPTLTGTNLTGVPFSGVTGTVPVNQGGTNLTSYTTGQLLYASAAGTLAGLSDVATGQVLASAGAGVAPAFTATPAFSGANITSGTIPGTALVSTPDITTCGAYTPTDLSGASLTFTSPTGIYCHTNHGDGTHSVYVQFDVTYPTTASGVAAAISLPYSGTGGANQAIASGYNTSAATLAPVVGGASVNFYALGTLSQRTNVLMSTFRIMAAGTYQSST